jgi:hypothetical protein
MKTRLPFGALALLSAGLLAGTAAAQNPGAHEHGHGRLNIVLDGKRLSIVLESPADDITGFEHHPETAEEKAKLDAVMALLGDAAKLYSLPVDAGCTHAGSEIESGLLEEHEGHGHDDHADKDKHGHGQDHGDHAKHDEHEEDGHAEFHVHHDFDCANPGALAFIDVKLFESFPSFHEIDVQYIVGSKQGGAELEHDKPRIDF